MFGRILEVSISGFADEIAAAASLVQGQGAEGQPVVLVRGLGWDQPATGAAELVRRGYGASQIAALWGGNFMRVLRIAEKAAG
jgi:F420-0:gamma-glutamyl ligase